MARRQLHELMLCGGAAEHQLALISDTTEIADTYPAFLHEEQPDNNNNQRKKKHIHLQIFPLKNGGITLTKTSVMNTINPK